MTHRTTSPSTIETATPEAARPSAAIEGEELYQLIKRNDIDPSEVEDVGSHAVEVSVLWKSSILHVAHLDGTRDFVLTARETPKAPAGKVTGAAWAVGGALMAVGAAMSDPTHLEQSAGLLWGGLGAATALAGSGVGISLSARNEKRGADTGRFVVGQELLNGASDLPVVLNAGGSRFVFLPGATGEVELQGARRSLEDLKAQGHARPSTAVPGGYEVNLQPDGRYRQEVGGLTLIARVVAPGRVVAGHARREPRLLGAIAGAGLAVAAAVLTMHAATTSDAALLTQGAGDDDLAELRAFIERRQEREPTPEPQAQPDEAQAPGGTGTRHAGPEGKMGRREAPARSARYGIQNRGERPHLARETARDALRSRGIFAAIGARGGAMSGGTSGIVSPFGEMTESGLDDRDANGNMTGDVVGDAFGAGGLGTVGTGWGGGDHGEGTIGTGRLNTLGHGDGTGPGFGIGNGPGTLGPRGRRPPTVRTPPPTVSGLLPPEAIRRVVLRNIGQVNHCYEQGLATAPGIAGRVVVRFVIGGTGTVMTSSAVESSLPVPSVGSCIANAARRWQFPAPDGNGVVTVNYPFNLQPADQ